MTSVLRAGLTKVRVLCEPNIFMYVHTEAFVITYVYLCSLHVLSNDASRPFDDLHHL